MAISDIRNAFTAAGEGQLVCQSALLNYDASGHLQLLTFAGTYSDGTPFRHTTEPFEGDPLPWAIEVAENLIAKRMSSHNIILPNSPAKELKS